jgi:hypothetical protein
MSASVLAAAAPAAPVWKPRIIELIELARTYHLDDGRTVHFKRTDMTLSADFGAGPVTLVVAGPDTFASPDGKLLVRFTAHGGIEVSQE